MAAAPQALCSLARKTKKIFLEQPSFYTLYRSGDPHLPQDSGRLREEGCEKHRRHRVSYLVDDTYM